MASFWNGLFLKRLTRLLRRLVVVSGRSRRSQHTSPTSSPTHGRYAHERHRFDPPTELLACGRSFAPSVTVLRVYRSSGTFCTSHTTAINCA